ncbi:MAG: glycosyltransferase family 39 protein [Isosphaeraceae bacterium]|nr:glycosyltransferase family 39 protein [Isosphaeraceae bacterium]
MTTRRALWGLIAVSTVLHLAWGAAIGPGNDEAYHYLFTVHRDWSYFDHPPMLAVVEALGVRLAGGTVSALSLRLGFIALFAGSTWLMARLTERFYGPKAGVLAAFALNVTAYHGLAASTFALPDGPLLFFWLLTLDRLAAALDAPAAKVGPWVQVGLAWGGALLSKYHAVFLPAGAVLYLLLDVRARAWLRRPGPYVAVALGVVLFTPVLWWNATHHWASFVFQGGRALGSLRFRPSSLALYFVGQIVYLCPWIWLRLVSLLVLRGRKLHEDAHDRFLVCQAAVPLVLFTAVASTREVLPHWTLVGFLSLFPMLGRFWAELWESRRPVLVRRLAWMASLPVLVGFLAVFEARTGLLQQGRPGGIGLLRAARDPTVDMIGWDQVADELKRRGLLDQPDTFLFTSMWYHSGHLAFATRGSSTPVLCYNPIDARSFAFWSRPRDWVGENGILVSVNNRMNEPNGYAGWFDRIEPLGAFEVMRGGAPVRRVRLFRCVRQTRPFPFDRLKPRGDLAGRREPEGPSRVR